MEKPFVIIDLEPHLHDFLYHDFEADKDGGILLNTSNEIGRYIQSMISVSDLPVRLPSMENPISLILPIQEWNHYVINHNFIHVVKWKAKMIQDFLEAMWRIRVREYFVAGYEKGYNQDRIINAFLTSYNIKKNKVSYDQIKKIDYRNRKKINKQIANEIQLSLSE